MIENKNFEKLSIIVDCQNIKFFKIILVIYSFNKKVLIRN